MFIRNVGNYLQNYLSLHHSDVEASWNVMAHAQKPNFVFRRNGRVHLNQQWRQFSRLLAAEACASAVVMLDTPCSEVVWRVLVTHSTRQFPLHFSYHASPCAIIFQLESTTDTPCFTILQSQSKITCISYMEWIIKSFSNCWFPWSTFVLRPCNRSMALNTFATPFLPFTLRAC